MSGWSLTVLLYIVPYGVIIMRNVGLYIHVPFCRSKCPYCDFYSLRSTDETLHGKYTDRVLENLREWSDKDSFYADTLYFGGGTPSLIGGENIARIVREAKRLFGVDGEITVECNPYGIEDGFFEALAGAGVNRISVGIQSINADERRVLGRLSNYNEIMECMESAVYAGITNISGDVMIGIPGQTEKSLENTLDFFESPYVKHISAYMLKIEEGTYYYNNIDKYDFPDDDTTADLYMYVCERLTDSGYNHYEISNFAKPGFESKHNLKYWNCEDYIGVGPAAHSFLGGKRLSYPNDIEYFLSGKEVQQVDVGGGWEEYVMLRLRLSEGVVFNEFERLCGFALPREVIERAEPFLRQGLIKLTEESLSLTREGFLLSNTIISELIYG